MKNQPCPDYQSEQIIFRSQIFDSPQKSSLNPEDITLSPLMPKSVAETCPSINISHKYSFDEDWGEDEQKLDEDFPEQKQISVS